MLFEELIVEIPNMEDRVQALRIASDILGKLDNLRNRGSCPCCDQPVDKRLVKQRRDEFELLYTDLSLEVSRMEDEKRKKWEAERPEKERLERERKQKVNAFIENNKAAFRKAIRDYRAGKKDYLPQIDQEDREIWNIAISKFVGNSNAYSDLDESDFQYDLGGC